MEAFVRDGEGAAVRGHLFVPKKRESIDLCDPSDVEDMSTKSD